jgi:hypothetical protein
MFLMYWLINHVKTFSQTWALNKILVTGLRVSVIEIFWVGETFRKKHNHLFMIQLKHFCIQIHSHSNYLFQILKLHMVLFKLEMIQANNNFFFTENKIIQINLTLLNYLKYYLLWINLKHKTKTLKHNLQSICIVDHESWTLIGSFQIVITNTVNF